MILSLAATEIIKRLNDASFEAYAVGGAVRDIIMGKTPHDIDIATNARAAEIKTLFCDKIVIPTGEKHGTVTILCGDEPIEVTTFRKDGAYIDSRHPSDVTFVDDVTEDLRRRDLTINAIAYNEQIGIVDPFGGRDDIKRKVIRAVGDPSERFHEDALRIMRAVRFASVLGFSIEEKTDAALRECYTLLGNISVERIFSELKLFLSGDFLDVLGSHLYIFSFLFPDWTLPLHLKICENDDTTTRLAYFFNGCGHDKADEYLRFLKSDTKTRHDVVSVLKALENEELKSKRDALLYLKRFGFENGVRAISLRGNTNEHKLLESAKNECYNIDQLDINGNDLISIGIYGSQIGETMKILLDAVIDGAVKNKKDELLRFLGH